MAARLGLAAGSGVLVVGVVPGTPAARAGIARNSVITAIDGQAVHSQDALGTALHVHKPRRATKPSRTAKAKRLESKRRQSAKKAARRAPPTD